MDDLFMARCQMGMSLAFHIVFAAIGIGLPLMMCIAEWLWLRTGDDVYHELAKRWSKIAAILFAVGAVSGTVLSFELGLLWPKFMEWSGEIIGLPFALEGFAFFTEAIFLGIYLYGWKLVPRAVHLASGVIVAISGLLSGLFVVLANGWMNTPTGFKIQMPAGADLGATGTTPVGAATANPVGAELGVTASSPLSSGIAVASNPATAEVASSHPVIVDPETLVANPNFHNPLGTPIDIDPVAAMFNPAGLPEALHMLIACYAATAFMFAGIHAYCLIKDRRNVFHRRALALSLALGAAMAILQPLTGDVLAKMVAERQPVKLAAFESLFDTKEGAPLLIGGIPDVEAGKVNFAIEIPHGLSFLAYTDVNAEVRGLKEFPRELWPNIPFVHYCFQIMVASGVIMSLIAFLAGVHFVRRREMLDSRAFLWAMSASAPLGFIAIEAGWMVTEVGRQPWIIQGVMRTKDAVTPMPGLMVPFLTFTALYLFLAVIVVWLIYRQVANSPVVYGKVCDVAPDSPAKGDLMDEPGTGDPAAGKVAPPGADEGTVVPPGTDDAAGEVTPSPYDNDSAGGGS